MNKVRVGQIWKSDLDDKYYKVEFIEGNICCLIESDNVEGPWKGHKKREYVTLFSG